MKIHCQESIDIENKTVKNQISFNLIYPNYSGDQSVEKISLIDINSARIKYLKSKLSFGLNYSFKKNIGAFKIFFFNPEFGISLFRGEMIGQEINGQFSVGKTLIEEQSDFQYENLYFNLATNLEIFSKWLNGVSVTIGPKILIRVLKVRNGFTSVNYVNYLEIPAQFEQQKIYENFVRFEMFPAQFNLAFGINKEFLINSKLLTVGLNYDHPTLKLHNDSELNSKPIIFSLKYGICKLKKM